MDYTREDKKGCAIIRYKGPFSIYEAPAIRDLLLECFASARGLQLDMEAVTECDTAGIQLLCSARATAEAEGKVFRINRMSEAVVQALTAGGLAPDKISGQGKEE